MRPIRSWAHALPTTLRPQALVSVATRSLAESKLDLSHNGVKVVQVTRETEIPLRVQERFVRSLGREEHQHGCGSVTKPDHGVVGFE